MTTLLADDVVRHPEIEPPKHSFELVSEYHPAVPPRLWIATSSRSGTSRYLLDNSPISHVIS